MGMILRFLVSTAFVCAAPLYAAPAAPKELSAGRHQATHDMFEHVVNIPTVFGRGKVPEMANYLAEQYRAAGFPAADVEVVSYESTDNVSKVTEKTAALIVRWRAPG